MSSPKSESYINATSDGNEFESPSAAECIRSSAAALRKVGADVDGLHAEAEAPLVPNKTTEAAMHEARAGGLPRYKSVEELIAEFQERGHSHDG